MRRTIRSRWRALLLLALAGCDGQPWVVARPGSPLRGRCTAQDEGPPWGEACHNDRDDDCDGQIDAQDSGCWSSPQVRLGRWRAEHPSPPAALLADVWVGDDGSAWAVGAQGLALRWDGRAWTQVQGADAQSLGRVWGAAPDDVWAVGQQGAAAHWNGRTWSPSATGSEAWLYGLWGLGPSAVWAWGRQSLLRWDGSTWAQLEPPTSSEIAGLWGVAEDDLWAVAYRQLFHWDGRAWSQVRADLDCDAAADLWGGGPGELWIACRNDRSLRGDGRTLAAVAYDADQSVLGLWGYPPAHAWAVGVNLQVARWDGGAAWQLVYNGGGANLSQVAGSAAAGYALALGGGALLHIDLEQGVTTPAEQVAWSTLADVQALDAEHVLACGSGGLVLRRDARGWRRLETGVSGYLLGLWAFAADDAWLVGEQVALRWDGQAFTRHDLAPILNAVWGSAPDDVWASGSDGALLHWDGASWQTRASGVSQTLYGLWGCRADEVWAVGGHTALRWDGSAWTRHDIPDVGSVWSVHGSGCDQVWAAGHELVARWDGSAWQVAKNDLPDEWDDVWVGGPDDVWVVGSESTQRWDGARWSQVALPQISLSGVHGLGDAVWLVGRMQHVLRWDRSGE